MTMIPRMLTICFSLLVLCQLFLLLRRRIVLHRPLLSTTRTAKQQSSRYKIDVDIPKELSTAEPCSFEQLQSAFGHIKNTKNKNKKKKKRCWSLADEIVRVPASSIVNRDSGSEHFVKLGNGCLGGVYKALVLLEQLPTSTFTTKKDIMPTANTTATTNTNNDGDATATTTIIKRDTSIISYCTAALKTDFCYDRLKRKDDKPKCRDNVGHSCIETRGGINYRSFMGGEYTGALPWYSQLHQQQLITPGLIPTWAIVMQDDETATDNVKRNSFLGRYSGPRPYYPDKRMVGVLLPLRSFDPFPFDTLVVESTELAHMMYPAAQGLALLSSLGLAMQDMMNKNLGLTRTRTIPPGGVNNTNASTIGDNDHHHKYYSRHAILFDNSYIGLQRQPRLGRRNCTTTRPTPTTGRSGDGGGGSDYNHDTTVAACPFCPESVFPKADRRKALLPGLDAIQTDMVKFRELILKVLVKCTDTQRAQGLKQRLLDCRDISQLVTVLEEHY